MCSGYSLSCLLHTRAFLSLTFDDLGAGGRSETTESKVHARFSVFWLQPVQNRPEVKLTFGAKGRPDTLACPMVKRSLDGLRLSSLAM